MMFDGLTDGMDDSVRVEQQQRKDVEYRLVGRERRRPGLTMFSYNTLTGDIKPAEIVFCKDVDFITRLPLHQPKLTVEPGCVYRQALNRKNLIKILRREGFI